MSPISLNNFEEILKAAKSLEELDDALKKYLNSWKITGYTFSYYAAISSKKNKLSHEVSSARLKTWHEYYHQEDFGQTDQTQSETSKALIPLFWDVQQQLHTAKTEKDRKMRQETLKFGVTMGVSIPLHSPGNEYAELTLRQFKDETCLNDWQHNKYEWQIAALYYYHYLKRYLLEDATKDINAALTKRERQCLNLLIQNFSTGEIAKNLKMTERTVNFHIQNLNRKLGTRNKYQSIAKVKDLKKL